jgi:hypothetical protein
MNRRLTIFLTLAALSSLFFGKLWAQSVSPWNRAQSLALLGEPSPAMATLLSRHQAAGGNPAFLSQVVREARELQLQGLPTQGFLLKANEGYAKRIPLERLNTGLQRARSQTVQAGKWIDGAVARGWKPNSPQERLAAIQSTQRALASGLDPAELSKMKGPGGSGSTREFEKQLQKLSKEKGEQKTESTDKVETKQKAKSKLEPETKQKASSGPSKNKAKIEGKTKEVKGKASPSFSAPKMGGSKPAKGQKKAKGK